VVPDYCHHLSPTINKWCPLRASDVHSLQSAGLFKDGREIYHYSNHPIIWVRLTGVIVAVDEYSGRKVYTLDDSSGVCIECTCVVSVPPLVATDLAGSAATSSGAAKPVFPRYPDKRLEIAKPRLDTSVTNPRVPWSEIDAGSVVKIKGRIGKFREQKQIDVVKIDIIRSTDEEVRCWNEVLTFRKDVLGKAWVISQEVEEESRREAMKEKHYKKGRKTSKDRRAIREAARESGDGSTAKDQLRSAETRYETGQIKDKKNKRKQREEQLDANVLKRKEESDTEGLHPVNRVNYPSLAVRRLVAGKYDALGI